MGERRTQLKWQPLSRWEKVCACLAAGTLLGGSIAATAAAYLDQASVAFAPVGATYDIAFVDGDGATHEGDTAPYEIESSQLPPIQLAGAEKPHRFDVTIRNTGSTDTGTVTLELLSLLSPQPADPDGVSRDPFEVMVVSVWDEAGTLLADGERAATLALDLEPWAAQEARTFTIELAFDPALPSPYYFAKPVRVGLTASGESA